MKKSNILNNDLNSNICLNVELEKDLHLLSTGNTYCVNTQYQVIAYIHLLVECASIWILGI